MSGMRGPMPQFPAWGGNPPRFNPQQLQPGFGPVQPGPFQPGAGPMQWGGQPPMANPGGGYPVRPVGPAMPVNLGAINPGAMNPGAMPVRGTPAYPVQPSANNLTNMANYGDFLRRPVFMQR
jgi:hypothetical protein